MADYHPLIARAVAGLEKNTGDGRRALYERARTALIAQLRSTEPALSESEITRERLALEEAIRKVEAESARQNRLEANRQEPKPKVRGPDPSRWEELARPPGAAAAPAASLMPQSRRSEAPVAYDAEPTVSPPRRPRPQPPGPGGDKRHSNTIFDQPPSASESNSPSEALDAPAAPAPQPRPQARTRLSMERRVPSPSEAGLKSLRSTVAEAGELGTATARTAKSARDAKAAAAVTDEPELRAPESAEDAARSQSMGEYAPDMLESSFAVDDSRPRALRGRSAQSEVSDDEETKPRRPARSYRELIKVGIAVVLLAGVGGVVASQWRNMVEFYRSVRAPSTEVAKETATVPPPAATNTSPKLNERFTPSQQGTQQAIVAPPPAGAPAAAVAQRVVLYEEDPNDPQGKQFTGSAIWRTEVVSPAPKQSPELAIRADIDVPERKLGVTWVLRRNTDQVLPASHTIEITFRLPPDFPAGGISNVPGILMKPAEQTRGIPLAGSAAKVTNGYFLIGLSAVETEKERNIQMLKERAWLDIPVVYNNGRRAILAVEKGVSGERVFEQAFAAWAQAK